MSKITVLLDDLVIGPHQLAKSEFDALKRNLVKHGLIQPIKVKRHSIPGLYKVYPGKDTAIVHACMELDIVEVDVEVG